MLFFRHAGIFPKNIFLQENNGDEKMKHLLKYSSILFIKNGIFKIK
jgi:hypothetical protein